MKEKHHIDDLFRQGLENFEGESRSTDWEQFEQLQAQRDSIALGYRKKFYYWGLAAAALLMVIGTLNFTGFLVEENGAQGLKTKEENVDEFAEKKSKQGKKVEAIQVEELTANSPAPKEAQNKPKVKSSNPEELKGSTELANNLELTEKGDWIDQRPIQPFLSQIAKQTEGLAEQNKIKNSTSTSLKEKPQGSSDFVASYDVFKSNDTVGTFHFVNEDSKKGQLAQLSKPQEQEWTMPTEEINTVQQLTHTVLGNKESSTMVQGLQESIDPDQRNDQNTLVEVNAAEQDEEQATTVNTPRKVLDVNDSTDTVSYISRKESNGLSDYQLASKPTPKSIGIKRLDAIPAHIKFDFRPEWTFFVENSTQLVDFESPRFKGWKLGVDRNWAITDRLWATTGLAAKRLFYSSPGLDLPESALIMVNGLDFDRYVVEIPLGFRYQVGNEAFSPFVGIRWTPQYVAKDSYYYHVSSSFNESATGPSDIGYSAEPSVITVSNTRGNEFNSYSTQDSYANKALPPAVKSRWIFDRLFLLAGLDYRTGLNSSF